MIKLVGLYYCQGNQQVVGVINIMEFSVCMYMKKDSENVNQCECLCVRARTLTRSQVVHGNQMTIECRHFHLLSLTRIM